MNSIFRLLPDKLFFIFFFLLVGILFIDIAFSRIQKFTINSGSTDPQVTLFFLMLFTCIIVQFFIAEFVRTKINAVARPLFKTLHPLAIFLRFQYLIMGTVLALVFAEMVIVNSYDSLYPKAVLWISYLQTISILIFTGYKFVGWLSINKNYLILLYAISVLFLSANSLFSLLYANDLLSVYVSSIQPNFGGFVATSGNQALIYAFQISSTASYLLMWLATSILIKNHSRKLGRVKYWVLISLPLVYFVLQFSSTSSQLLYQIRSSDPVLFGIVYTLFFSASKPIGGIIFGAGLWIAGLKISDRQVRLFMIFGGCGIILFFASNQAFILATLYYPPFGLVSVSCVGLGGILFFIGIYTATISAAQDGTVRKSIKRNLEDESVLLRGTSKSEMEKQIQSRVLNMSKKLSEQLKMSSGVPNSLEEGEIKDYIHDILEEMKVRKK